MMISPKKRGLWVDGFPLGESRKGALSLPPLCQHYLFNYILQTTAQKQEQEQLPQIMV
jgi:hypothetical protein